MSELSEIKEDIKDTKAKLKKAEEVGDKDEVKELRALLTKQTGVWENLLVIQGKFQFLSLHIALSNPVPSTFMIHNTARQTTGKTNIICSHSSFFTLFVVFS